MSACSGSGAVNDAKNNVSEKKTLKAHGCADKRENDAHVSHNPNRQKGERGTGATGKCAK